MAGGALPALLLVVSCCPFRVGILPRGIGEAAFFLSYGSGGGRRGEEEGCATHCWRPCLRGRRSMSRIPGAAPSHDAGLHPLSPCGRKAILWAHFYTPLRLASIGLLRRAGGTRTPVSLTPARPTLAHFGPRGYEWVLGPRRRRTSFADSGGSWSACSSRAGGTSLPPFSRFYSGLIWASWARSCSARPSSFTALPSSLVGLWMRAWR
ncbi:hypothetical protein FB451DRAFT_96145 [Mycena latifolia]|nr:hypothetical protein FB451DRAFT_96145 [Mycena latifolia]